MFLGLRLSEGVCSREFVESLGGAVKEMVEDGLMWDEGGRWGLTLRGRMVSNEVFGRLLEDVAA